MVGCSTSTAQPATLSRSPFPLQSSATLNPSEHAPQTYGYVSQAQSPVETPSGNEQTRTDNESHSKECRAPYSNDDQRPALIFDMFGDMNITELNFEELDAACTPVDSLLFDATFPEQNADASVVTDKIKAEEISSSHSLGSTLSCTAATSMHGLPLEHLKPGVEPDDYLISSFTTQEQSGGSTDDLDVDSLCTGGDVPFLNLDNPVADIKSCIAKLSDSASSESHPINDHVDIGAVVAVPLVHAQHAQHAPHEQHVQHAQHSQHVQHAHLPTSSAPSHSFEQQDLSRMFFQSPHVMHDNLLASMMPGHFGAYQQAHNAPSSAALAAAAAAQHRAHHAHSMHHMHPAAGSYYGQSTFGVPSAFRYDVTGALGASSEGSVKKGAGSKRYKLTQPSKFCHVCVRSGDQVRLAPCANVTSGLCRKAVCEKCFEKHGFAHEWAAASLNYAIIAEMNSRMRDTLPDQVWTCFHCRSQCPPSAQCKIYARTNKRRHNILKQKKAAKERAQAERTPNIATGAISKAKNRKGIISTKA